MRYVATFALLAAILASLGWAFDRALDKAVAADRAPIHRSK